jgi:hypothetical protein
MNSPKKKIRSAFSSGVNLGGSVHKPRKGKGSYKRKKKIEAE